jgi:hypothetical protein
MNEGLYHGVGTGVPGSFGRFTYQVVEISQTISPPAWAKYVSILGIAGGGGGGGGRLDNAGTAGGGAGGGGGGAKYTYRFPLFMFRTTVLDRFNITIGAGGTGGAGATTNGFSGAQGTAGGQTRVIMNSPTLVDARIQCGVICFGGNQGGGGTQSFVNGGTGGTAYAGNTGGQGGGGSNGTTGQYPFGRPSWSNGPIAEGGYGGSAKASTAGKVGLVTVPSLLAQNYAQAAVIVAPTENGMDAELVHSNFTRQYLLSLTKAPQPHEVWFTSCFGGECGYGRDTSGLNGGKGWRGSGGGGGGGAGATQGGNGGAGGNGVVYFFWEEV